MQAAVTGKQGLLLGVALVVTATVGWSLAGFFVRELPELTGWQINCWRGFFTAVWLGVFMLARYRGQAWSRVREVPLGALVSCAVFFALGSTLYVTALTLTATANVSCIEALAPFMTALLSRIFIGERAGLVASLAALGAVGGVALIMRDSMAGGHWLGNAFALLTALSFSLQTMMLRRYSGIDMVPAICLGGLMVLALAATFGDGLAVPPRAIGILALMALLQLAIPLALFARGARYVPAVMLNLLALLDVVLNPFWAWLGTGERPPAATYLGGSIILSAVAVSVVAQYRRTRGGG